jgi:hypothetical protein
MHLGPFGNKLRAAMRRIMRSQSVYSLDRPQFRDWLNTEYKLETERKFTLPVRGVGRFVVPPGYRLYVHYLSESDSLK